MNPLFLPFITAIAANSFLCLGFGIRRLVSGRGRGGPRTFAPAMALVLSGAVVWPLFSLVLAPFSLGYLEMILLAPLSVLISSFSDRLSLSVLSGSKDMPREADSSAFSAYDGLTYAASFLVLRLASTFIEALLLAAGAAIGYVLCSLALRAIRDRADTEPVPRCLRGVPLMLIAAGLMAILATFLASVLFNAQGYRA